MVGGDGGKPTPDRFRLEEGSVARVQVVADDGYVALTERVSAQVLDEEHFRGCLAERIAWAAADADAHEDGEPPKGDGFN
jgi:hypothetical protein